MKLIDPEKIEAAINSNKNGVPKQRRQQLADHVRDLIPSTREDFFRVIPRLDLPAPEEAFVRSLFADAPAANVVAMPDPAAPGPDLTPAA